MIGVYAEFQVAEGRTADFEQVMGSFMSAVKATEPGTITYQLFANSKVPGTYFFLEVYADADALAAHGKTDHMAALAPQIGPLLAAPPKIIKGTAVH